MHRSIVHMDLDSFFVSVERLKDVSLIGKPLIIGGLGDRSVVSSCSYEARAFGVRSAMPMSQARRLCPQAIVLGGSMSEYGYYSGLVTAVIADQSPLYEKASIDEFYIDITGMDKFFGAWKWSNELKSRIVRETGLPISFALSTSKTVSKIGTGESKPNGQRHIEAGKEMEFLAPLPIRKIPMLGEKSSQALQKTGIQFIGDIQRLESEDMERILGNMGLHIWNKARGICDSPVQPFHEQKSISTEQTFEKDITDLRFIRDLIAGMAEKLAYSIRKKNKLTKCVTIKIRYSDFETQSIQQHLPATSTDHEIIQLAHVLFEKLYQPGGKIRLIGLRLSDLQSGAYQIRLFDDKPEMNELYQVMDKLRNKFGKAAIHRANTSTTRKKGPE
ncbi:MAG: hypothetical protein RLZZ543_2070 [Bacteroidota bacterium]